MNLSDGVDEGERCRRWRGVAGGNQIVADAVACEQREDGDGECFHS